MTKNALKPSFKKNLKAQCHLCGSPFLDAVTGFESLPTVTSDCKPWHKGLTLCLCRSCGCVQKLINPRWKSGTKKIYRSYSIYHQSSGIEQPTFNQRSGQPSPRSKKLLQYVLSRVKLPQHGRMLDIGCGTGTLLRSFGAFKPEWSLSGQDMNPRHGKSVEPIPHVEMFYSCAPEKIPGTYDFIALLHSIEHILSPREFLKTVGTKLKKDGVLLIHTANFMKNPFDLVIADHCTHFTLSSLTYQTENAGYQVCITSAKVIPKEITVIARKSKTTKKTGAKAVSKIPVSAVRARINWLKCVAESAYPLSEKKGFGIFGTSIAATWLYTVLAGNVQFFADEDPDRIGKTFMDKPIYSAASIPAKSNVYIALPLDVARAVHTRIKATAPKNVRFHNPPDPMQVNAYSV